MAECLVCGVPDKEKPMVFRGAPYCCDDHRKVMIGEKEPTTREWETMHPSLFSELGGVCRRE